MAYDFSHLELWVEIANKTAEKKILYIQFSSFCVPQRDLRTFNRCFLPFNCCRPWSQQQNLKFFAFFYLLYWFKYLGHHWLSL